MKSFRKVADGIWKFTGTDAVNAYFLDLDKKIIIDAGNRSDHDAFRAALEELIDPAKIDIVLFTHLHHDHRENFDLFTDARFYASAQEIEDFRKKTEKLDDQLPDELVSKLRPFPKDLSGIEVIPVPGHTRGSVLFWLESQGALFTGDTFFREGIYGRTDLPWSSPDDMEQSLKKVSAIPYRMLCPGHDY